MKEVFQKLFYRRESRDDGAIVIWPKIHRTKLYSCGHTGSVQYEIIAHDLSFTSKSFGSGRKGLCQDCAADEIMCSIIKCVNCAKPIVPTQMVSVVNTEPEDHRKLGIHFMNDGRQVVMCCGPGCSNGDFTGWWNGQDVDRPKY